MTKIGSRSGVLGRYFGAVNSNASSMQLKYIASDFTRALSTRRRGRISKKNETITVDADEKAAPPPAVSLADSWTEVKDEQTGQYYYWNKATNETTALGAPKPTTDYLAQSPAHQNAQVQGYQQPGAPSFGQTMKEGFAFGAGAGIARGVIGSMFGGWGGGGSSDDNDGNGSGWV